MVGQKLKKSVKVRGVGFYKIRSVGNGLSITVPNDFVEAEGLKARQWVKVSWSNHVLTVELVSEE